LGNYHFLNKYSAAGSTGRKWIVLTYRVKLQAEKITSVAYEFWSENENSPAVTEAGVCDGITWQKGECTCGMYENSKIYNDARKNI